MAWRIWQDGVSKAGSNSALSCFANEMKGWAIDNQDKVQQADKETAKKIISGSFSRVANREVESGIDLEPGKELISSAKIVEL